MIEREVKLRVAGLDAVRSRLQEAGGTLLHASARERNTLYDRRGELRDAECVLRIRNDGQGSRLTFKGPATFDGSIKQRTELETSVAESDTLEAILLALGYERTLVYEKDREEWRLGDAVIALDVTPMGDFVEVEASDPSPVLERLQLSDIDPETLSYIGLWQQARRLDASLGPDMVFPEEITD